VGRVIQYAVKFHANGMGHSYLDRLLEYALSNDVLYCILRTIIIIERCPLVPLWGRRLLEIGIEKGEGSHHPLQESKPGRPHTQHTQEMRKEI
jgi:hypothetical protein